MRNGAAGTNPALCKVHQVVFAEAGRPPAPRPPAVAAFEVLEDLLSGERVSRARVESAISELFSGWTMGGNIAQGYYPDLDPSAPQPGFRPPSGFRPPPGWPFQGAPGAPPFDPEAAELAEARRRARLVMGFAASEPITREILRARHRELVRKHHPDRGGDLEKMKLVNAANDVLEDSL